MQHSQLGKMLHVVFKGPLTIAVQIQFLVGDAQTFRVKENAGISNKGDTEVVQFLCTLLLTTTHLTSALHQGG